MSKTGDSAIPDDDGFAAYMAERDPLQQQLAAVTAERDALRGYAVHRPGCPLATVWIGSGDRPDRLKICQCGLSDLLETPDDTH